jgi:peroxiredoxin
MAYTESNMLPLGTKAPNFTLPDTISAKEITLYEMPQAKATLIMFLCNHCPYVIHVNPEIVRIAADYKNAGVQFVSISSNNAIKYPQDGPEKMTEHAKETGYTFPYLYDESQEIARKYDAACTPDFYLFDEHLHLVYRGRIDSSRPGNDKPLDGSDLRQAIDNVLAGKEISPVQYPSAGCNIKWK